MSSNQANPEVSSGPLAKLRGFAVRTGVGAALILLLGLSAWLWLWGVVLIVAAFLALGAHELGQAAGRHGWHPAWAVVAFGGVALLIVEYGGWCGDVLVVGMVGCAAMWLVGLAWRLRGPVGGFLGDVAVTGLLIVYLPLLMTFVVAMLTTAHPVAQAATYMGIIIIGDSGAYIMGSLLGRHKMAPHISPAKTWEGVAGCLVWAGIAGALLAQFVLHVPYWQGIVLGVVLGAGAVVGDLAESAIKRDVGVKDMGKLLPGHGGAMDRLDSMVFCAPIAWALMNLWMHVG